MMVDQWNIKVWYAECVSVLIHSEVKKEMQLLSYFHEDMCKKNSICRNVDLKCELEQQIITGIHIFPTYSNSHLTCKGNQYISVK